MCFSGDKLLGGPQAGIIAGRKKMVDALKREPLFRALRCDKLILSALEATVDTYLRGETRIPVLEMLQRHQRRAARRAERIVAALDGLPLAARVGAGRAQIGGGTLPRSALPSVTLDRDPRHARSPGDWPRRLREQPIPVIGYVARGSRQARSADDLSAAGRET